MHRLVFSFNFAFVIIWTFAQGLILQELSTERIKITSLLSSQQLVFSQHKTTSLHFLSQLANLGLYSSFRHVNGKILKSAKGIKRVRLMQTFANYDVFGTSVEAELDANEYLSGQMYGEIVKNIHKDIPHPEACQQVLKGLQIKAFKLQGVRPNDPNIEKKDGRRLIFAGPRINKPRLAYKIEFFYKNASSIKYPVYFFDACSGDVLMTYDKLGSMLARTSTRKLHSTLKNSFTKAQINESTTILNANRTSCSVSCRGLGGNTKKGRVNYNTSPFCLNVKKFLTFCTFNGDYTKLIDNEGSTRTTKKTAVRALCAVGYRDSVNDAYGVANDAFFHGEIFGSFFENEYDMTVLNYKPRLVVHFDRNLENAYSDGTDTYYGDGEFYFFPLVSLDIVAHELAHAVTDKNSRLIYRGMSGGINEAFSDITGATVSAWFNNGNTDWKIGANTVKYGNALRFMDDPPRDGSSIKSIFGYRPYMGVHSSSGIFNHAFYSMVTSQDMDIFDAYKCFLDANLNLWGPFTNFFSGACKVMQAAYDNGFNHRKVRRAFWRVGIPLIFCNYAALTTSMFVGETREEIQVSASRSPIIKVELDREKSNVTSVRVLAEDNSDIQIVIGMDKEAARVKTRGTNVVKLFNINHSVYVKLMSKSRTDISVQMTILSEDTLA